MLSFTRFRPIVVGPFNKKTSDDGKAQTAKYLGILDQYLADKTFLVGQRITYADILTAAIVQRGCDHVSSWCMIHSKQASTEYTIYYNRSSTLLSSTSSPTLLDSITPSSDSPRPSRSTARSHPQSQSQKSTFQLRRRRLISQLLPLRLLHQRRRRSLLPLTMRRRSHLLLLSQRPSTLARL